MGSLAEPRSLLLSGLRCLQVPTVDFGQGSSLPRWDLSRPFRCPPAPPPGWSRWRRRPGPVGLS